MEHNQQFSAKKLARVVFQIRFWTLTLIILLSNFGHEIGEIAEVEVWNFFVSNQFPRKSFPKNLVSTKHPSAHKNLCHATRTFKDS